MPCYCDAGHTAVAGCIRMPSSCSAAEQGGAVQASRLSICCSNDTQHDMGQGMNHCGIKHADMIKELQASPMCCCKPGKQGRLSVCTWMLQAPVRQADTQAHAGSRTRVSRAGCIWITGLSSSAHSTGITQQKAAGAKGSKTSESSGLRMGGSWNKGFLSPQHSSHDELSITKTAANCTCSRQLLLK
jgi:hypothetical protein